MKPMMFIASEECFLPAIFKTESARTSVAPDSESISPSRAPRPNTMPRLPRIPPKPPVMLETIWVGCSLMRRPTATHAEIIAKKGWILSLAMAIIRYAMAARKTMIVNVLLMITSLLSGAAHLNFNFSIPVYRYTSQGETIKKGH